MHVSVCTLSHSNSSYPLHFYVPPLQMRSERTKLLEENSTHWSREPMRHRSSFLIRKHRFTPPCLTSLPLHQRGTHLISLSCFPWPSLQPQATRPRLQAAKAASSARSLTCLVHVTQHKQPANELLCALSKSQLPATIEQVQPSFSGFLPVAQEPHKALEILNRCKQCFSPMSDCTASATAAQEEPESRK